MTEDSDHQASTSSDAYSIGSLLSDQHNILVTLSTRVQLLSQGGTAKDMHIAAQDRALARYEIEVKALQDRIEALQNESSMLVEAHSGEIASFERMIADRDRTIERLSSETAGLASQLSDQEAMIDRAQNELSAVRRHVAWISDIATALIYGRVDVVDALLADQSSSDLQKTTFGGG